MSLSRRDKQVIAGAALGLGGLVLMMQGRQRKTPAPGYEITPEDRIWLLRAVEAEGPPETDVARTLVNLFTFRRDHGYSGTLATLVRSYASPVNPRWYPSGDKFRAEYATLPESKKSAALAAANRREAIHSTRETFTEATRAAVDAALNSGWGTDWTDYAAPSRDAIAETIYTRRTKSESGKNTFWTRAPNWPGYNVTPAGMLVKA